MHHRFVLSELKALTLKYFVWSSLPISNKQIKESILRNASGLSHYTKRDWTNEAQSELVLRKKKGRGIEVFYAIKSAERTFFFLNFSLQQSEGGGHNKRE